MPCSLCSSSLLRIRCACIFLIPAFRAVPQSNFRFPSRKPWTSRGRKGQVWNVQEQRPQPRYNKGSHTASFLFLIWTIHKSICQVWYIQSCDSFFFVHEQQWLQVSWSFFKQHPRSSWIATESRPQNSRFFPNHRTPTVCLTLPTRRPQTQHPLTHKLAASKFSHNRCFVAKLTDNLEQRR